MVTAHSRHKGQRSFKGSNSPSYQSFAVSEAAQGKDRKLILNLSFLVGPPVHGEATDAPTPGEKRAPRCTLKGNSEVEERKGKSLLVLYYLGLKP